MKKVVYILGSTRCGTTMFDLVISSHSDCASVGELCFLHKRACGFCGSECKHWVRYSKMLKKPHYYHTAFDVFGADILVDSSKKWRWLKDRAKHEDYEYKVIHVVRNGLDRLRFRKRQDKKIRPYVVSAWVNTYHKCKKLIEKFSGIEVRYEDIVHDETFEKIFNFIGIQYDPKYRRFWEYEHHGLLGSKTAYSLVRAHKGKDSTNNYVDIHGFNLTPRIGHEFLSEKDIDVFNRYGGRKLNKELGYK